MINPMTLKEWQDAISKLSNMELSNLRLGLNAVLKFGPIAEHFEHLKDVLTMVDIEQKRRID